MENKIEELIENLVKEAEKSGAKVEVRQLNICRPQESKGKLCFDFYEDGDIRCSGENINTKRVLLGIHQLIRLAMELEDVSYDKAIELIEKSKEIFESDYAQTEGKVHHESN